MQHEDLPYRPCVGIMLLNREGLVWIGRRSSDSPEIPEGLHEWQMPQGGIDPGEDPQQTALRELHEETNIRSVSLLHEAPDWVRYDLPDELVGRAWKGRYRGQMQKWLAYRFTGADEEIDIATPAGGVHRPEFSDWRWERMEALPDLIIPFKRAAYEQVVAMFRHLAP